MYVNSGHAPKLESWQRGMTKVIDKYLNCFDSKKTEAEISVESVLALLSDDFCLIPQVPGTRVTVEWSSKNRRHAT